MSTQLSPRGIRESFALSSVEGIWAILDTPFPIAFACKPYTIVKLCKEILQSQIFFPAQAENKVKPVHSSANSQFSENKSRKVMKTEKLQQRRRSQLSGGKGYRGKSKRGVLSDQYLIAIISARHVYPIFLSHSGSTISLQKHCRAFGDRRDEAQSLQHSHY